MSKKPERPRNIASDILDCLEDGFSKWTKQRKSEERAPSNIRYRETRLTKSSRVTQKDAAWGGDERCLHGRECPRHAAGFGSPNPTTKPAPKSWQ